MMTPGEVLELYEKTTDEANKNRSPREILKARDVFWDEVTRPFVVKLIKDWQQLHSMVFQLEKFSDDQGTRISAKQSREQSDKAFKLDG